MNHFADCMWAWALSWCGLVTFEKRTAIIVTALVVGANEFLQLTPVVYGTFDWYDLVLELLMVVLACLVWNNKKRKRTTKQQY